MNNRQCYLHILSLSLLSLMGGVRGGLFAQERVPHTSALYSISATSAVPVVFHTEADLDQYPIPAEPLLWGMDVAWDSEDNVRRGTNYIGQSDLSVGRVSFQPSDVIGEDGELSAAQKNALQKRLNHIAVSGVKDLILNCDHEVLCNKDNYPNCDQSYANYYGKPQEWLKVIRASVRYCRSKGFNVVTISPFNEPDYTAWKEGTQSHFKAIAELISEDPELAGIRISAGNTLNCDQASSWYTAVKPYVTEGNTHQLAGSFDNYAAFWQRVRKDGNHATADELHNVGEAFIGAHYGLQTGVWWGWDGVARGEYCRASRHGKEIGYGEDRKAWAAATVYKREDGRIDAFLGTSERQATPSSFEFISADAPVYYNGHGPYYNYQVDMPGGTGYQKGQTNAELMLNVQYGNDVPMDAIVPGRYVIMNAATGRCLGTYNNGTNSGVSVVQRFYGTAPSLYYQWIVEDLPANSGGDLSYFLLRWGKDESFLLDLKNWSTTAGGTVIAYPGGKGTNEHWFTEYAGNGFWYIRSRHSGLYLEVKSVSTSLNVVVQQATFTGSANQQWRFLPYDENPKLELQAPAIPTGLQAEVRNASVLLTWEPNTDEDLAGYVLLRDGNVVARKLQGTQFLDNEVCPGKTHQYSIRAVDVSRNLSEASEPVEVTLSQEPALVLHCPFEKDSLDQSSNMFDPMAPAKMLYSSVMKKVGEYAVQFKNTSPFLQLPTVLGSYDYMTIAMWIYSSSTTANQRVLDWGNGPDQYIYLTPNNGSDMELVICNGSDKESLTATRVKAGGWHHIAVVISPDSIALCLDGSPVTSTTMKLRPSDFCPKRNYLGRGQRSTDPTYTGYLDDLRIYNTPLTVEQINLIIAGEEPVGTLAIEAEGESAKSVTYSLSGYPVRKDASSARGLRIEQGKIIFNP